MNIKLWIESIREFFRNPTADKVAFLLGITLFIPIAFYSLFNVLIQAMP